MCHLKDKINWYEGLGKIEPSYFENSIRNMKIETLNKINKHLKRYLRVMDTDFDNKVVLLSILDLCAKDFSKILYDMGSTVPYDFAVYLITESFKGLENK